MTKIKAGQRPILLGLLLLLVAAATFLDMRPYQIVSYFSIIGLYAILIYATNGKVNYSKTLFLGLFIWAVAHIAGGGINIDGHNLYSQIIFPISSSLPIIRYDQIVHGFGFAMATLLIYELLAGRVKNLGKFTLGFVVVMAGLGLGALNEILEFIIGRFIHDSNVGEYINSSLDLVADFVGALAVLLIIFKREKTRHKQKSTRFL